MLYNQDFYRYFEKKIELILFGNLKLFMKKFLQNFTCIWKVILLIRKNYTMLFSNL